MRNVGEIHIVVNEALEEFTFIVKSLALRLVCNDFANEEVTARSLCCWTPPICLYLQKESSIAFIVNLST